MTVWQRENKAAKRLTAIPGGGLLSATAAAATIGDAHMFRSGREFAVFLCLVPRQTGTGGRVKLLGISKRGDVYMRTLLIHGARAVLARNTHLSEAVQRPLARRPFNVVVVALANKSRARSALLAHDRAYEPGDAARTA